MKYLLMLFLLFVFSSNAYSQACCSAGTPLLGSLEISTGSEKTLQLGLTYDYNSLQSVLEGTKRINDDTRERLTTSILLEATYGISRNFAVTGLFSFVDQNRTVTPIEGNKNEISSKGLGDVVLLLKYNLSAFSLTNQTELSIGVGSKLPVGSSDITANGVLLPADIQSGSGSWDALLWGFYSQGFMPSMPLTFFANVSYKLNTANARFASSKSGYKFGNEFILSSGVGYRTDTPLDFTLFLRYRNTTQDQFDDENVPNTGGNWLYAVPGINIKVADQITSRISGQIPIFRDLQGTQLTTSYSVSLSLFYNYTFD